MRSSARMIGSRNAGLARVALAWSLGFGAGVVFVSSVTVTALQPGSSRTFAESNVVRQMLSQLTSWPFAGPVTDKASAQPGDGSAEKSSLAMTTLFQTALPARSKADLEVSTDAEQAASVDVQDDDGTVASLDPGQAGFGASDELPAGARRASLFRDPRSGLPMIGDFSVKKLPAAPDACIGLGYALLDDIGVSSDAVTIVAQASMISVARICARNGSIILTCRHGEAVLSPRRPRPDDKCEYRS